jgi:hypothetical protein
VLGEYHNTVAETLLQAAQVINASNAVRERAQAEDERLKQKQQQFEESMQLREAASKAREDLVAAQTELAKARAQKTLEDAAVVQQNADTKMYNAETYARNQTEKERHNRTLETYRSQNVKPEEVQKYIDNQDAALIMTGDGPDDIKQSNPGLLRTPLSQLRTMRNSAQGVASGMKANMGTAEMQMLHQADPAAFATDPIEGSRNLMRTIDRIAVWREGRIKSVIAANPDTPANIKNALAAYDLRDAISQPREGEGSIGKAQGDQSAAQGQQAPGTAPATPGTVSAPVTPETDRAMQQINGFSPEMLNKSDGVASAASLAVSLIQERLRAGDRGGVLALQAQIVNKSAALDAKVRELLKANKKK